MNVTKDYIEKDYIKRINAALVFIEENLSAQLALEEIASIACYSPFHFHRLFKAIVGESLNAYINRRRIEKAAAFLMHNDSINMEELAFQHGFNSNSSFTRAFKNFYGVSPSAFKQQQPHRYSKIRQTDSKNGQNNLIFEQYICNINNHLKWLTMNARIEVKEMSELHFASITHIGVDGLEHAFERLLRWSTPQQLLNIPNNKMARIFHDSFKVTSPDKVKMSVSMLLNSPFEETGEVKKESLGAGKWIVGSFELKMEEFEKSWTSLYIWMNENGYQKADKPPFEIYHNDFRQHPEGKCIVDLHIPIK